MIKTIKEPESYDNYIRYKIQCIMCRGIFSCDEWDFDVKTKEVECPFCGTPIHKDSCSIEKYYAIP